MTHPALETSIGTKVRTFGKIMERICFVGDVHLGYATDPERAGLFCRFLRAVADFCAHVVILGDLFDFWFDYRTVIPRAFWQAVAALGELRQRGITVDYLMGNHDFGHWRFFRDELGIEPHRGDLERQWHGKRFYIAHGDGKMKGEWGYLALRWLLRNRAAQGLYRLLHPDVGIGIARWASHLSRRHASGGSQRLVESLESFALQKLRQGFDAVVLGHSHVPVLKALDRGWYLNPGGWLDPEPRFAYFDGHQLRLMRVREFIDAIGRNSSSSAISL